MNPLPPIYLGNSVPPPTHPDKRAKVPLKAPQFVYDWLQAVESREHIPPEVYLALADTSLCAFHKNIQLFPEHLRPLIAEAFRTRYENLTQEEMREARYEHFRQKNIGRAITMKDILRDDTEEPWYPTPKPDYSNMEAIELRANAVAKVTRYLYETYEWASLPFQQHAQYLHYFIRDRHMHIMGKTGAGKSSFLHWLIYNDIKHGQRVCVIDPKGTLVSDLLYWIPENRIDDCIFLDIHDPVPLNFMSCLPGREDRAVSDLKFILAKGVSPDHAPALTANIENIIYALLYANQHPKIAEDGEPASFLDIFEFLENKNRFKFICDHITEPRLQAQWRNSPLDKADSARVKTRINSIIRSATLSKIFGPPNADPNRQLDIANIVNGPRNHVLLVSVPTNEVGASDYGALIVSKIQQAAFARKDPKTSQRFYLYIDEFQNFRASEAFEKILEMAREFQLCLTLANLKLDDLDSKVMSALGIIASYVAFSIYEKDTHFYSAQMKPHDHELLAHLKPYRAMFRIGAEPPFFAATPSPSPTFHSHDHSDYQPPTPEQLEKARYIKKRTLERYSYKPTPVFDTNRDGKDDDIQPTAPPAHASKKKNA